MKNIIPAENQSKPATAAPVFVSRHRRWRLLGVVLLSIVAGYLVAAYVVAPLFWESYAHLHPALDDVPGITVTGDRHPGDPLNVALIGTKEDLQRIMKQAGWFRADALGIKADLKIAADTVLKRPYDDAPVSDLFLFGRKEDFAFEQPVGNDPRQRHHVRFWQANQLDEQGRPLWMGSATYDKRVGLSETTGQITHHISGDVDQERDHLMATLQATGDLTGAQFINDFHRIRTGKNGGGDRWETDGRLAVAVITPAAK